MNRVYHVVWNRSKGVWQAASELSHPNQSSSGSAGGVAGSLKTISAGALLLIALPLHASNLPSGGTVVGGQGSINSSDKTLTVDQNSQNMAIDWQDFSIAEGHTVNFNQPNAQATALNRVTGNNVSDIRGALNANGRVFLVNPNGVMFSPTARVDVGALVTSTLDISTEDFMAGNYHFEGASANAIINQGNITTAEGGVVAMIAAEIINTGSIITPQGSTLMGAGSKVTLDLGGPVKIEVEEALLDSYIEQGGAIRADGGLVYLTAKAAGNLASSVINHTGVTEARTLATGEDGRIMLMGDMESGRVQVAGKLDASAPNGGDGGFIETSAANVSILDEATVTTKADSGETGEWLIDPYDFTIAESGGDITGQALSSALGLNDVTIETLDGSVNCTHATCGNGDNSGNGDIFVNDDIHVSAGDTDTTLTLKAYRSIIVDADKRMSSESGKLNLVFWARAGGDQNATDTRVGSVWLKGGSSVFTNGGDITIGGGMDPSSGYARGVGIDSGEGNAITRGASINGTLDAGGGDISIHGRGRLPNKAGRGVSIGGEIRTEGTGNISIHGHASYGSDAIAIGDGALNGDESGNVSAGTGTVYLVGQRDTGNSINVNNGSSITSSGKVVLDGLNGEIVSGINDYIRSDELLILNASKATFESAQNDFNTFSASNISSGGLSIIDRDVLTVGDVSWDGVSYQGVQAAGSINIATLSGNLVVEESISSDSGLNNAITLNAGRSESAGTSTGGDILIAGGNITTGPGGRALLYTGSIDGSTGLTNLVGSGSGRFRYNSDESSVGYTEDLGNTGLYAIYREQPKPSVTPPEPPRNVDTGTRNNPVPGISVQTVQQMSRPSPVTTGVGVATGDVATLGQSTGLQVVDVDSTSVQNMVGSGSSVTGPLQLFVIDGGISSSDDS